MKKCVDLFCGAGGTSTGLLMAARDLSLRIDLLAINHWNIAIDSHTRNHPDVTHLCESLDSVDPRKVTSGKLDLLCASPECTHHSNARGGRPRSDQSRASAWHVVRWAEALQPENILIENVREFRTWGPLRKNGKPIKRKKGHTYRAFINALLSLDYIVEERCVDCSEFGDATSRLRLFIMARRRKAITWPTPTHGPSGALPRRPAREIIDWSLRGKSIFNRKRPLAVNSIARIVDGLREFGGPALEPFIIHLTHHGKRRGHSIHKPLPTITTAHRGEMALVQPFLVNFRGTGDSHIESSAGSIEEPLRTISAGGNHIALCEPFVIGQQSGATARRVSNPLLTIATAGAIALIEPFLVKYNSTGGALSVDEPLDTISTRDRFGLVQPIVDGQALEILLRMLQPQELAAATSFPKNYSFAGSRAEQIKQIGNAVPVRTAAALCKALLQ